MNLLIAIAALFICTPSFAKTAPAAAAVNAQAPKDGTLTSSRTIYTISHSFKTADGTSTKALGKSRCDAQKVCEVLISVPVNSFDSGNSNRDSHMVQTVKGAANPDIVVRASGIKFIDGEQKVRAEIDFAGKKISLDNVSIKIKNNGPTFTATSNFDFMLSHFSIIKPSLLGFTIDDKVHVAFDGTFKAD